MMRKSFTHVPECLGRQSKKKWHSVQGFAPLQKAESKDVYSISKRSFTLIELLVVIAIIGMLSSFFLPNFMGARERARDTQRKNDLKQIQKALEMYRQDQTFPVYPTPFGGGASVLFGSCGTAFGSTPVYLNKTPCDPLNPTPTPYYYKLDSTVGYFLCACLENKADSEGINGNCDTGYTCTQGKKYVLNEP